jgi:hypothetical protein
MIVAVKRVAVTVLALGVCVPVALAAKGDPQKKLTAAGQARAKQASLRPGDLPGWRASPHKKSSDDSDPRCSYYNPDQSDLVEIGDYDSPDFDRADGSSISVSTGVFRSVRMGKAAYSRVAQPALAKCLAELFRKGAGVPRTTIFSSAPLRFPSYGDRSDAFRIVASVRAPTARVRVYLDIFLVNKGAVDIAMLALGIVNPLPAALEQSLVSKLAARAT